MVDVPVNYVAVIVAAVANMALGFVWFGPLFGKQWIALSGWSKEEVAAGMAKMKKDGWKNYSLALIGSLVMAYVLAHSIVFATSYFSISAGIKGGLMAGFWSWLGFIAPVTMGSVLWEGKSWKLWFLTNAYYLVALLVMGMILSSSM